jgi:hypothetical protein
MFGPDPAANVQVVDGLKLPVLFVENVTLPVGMAGLVELSITWAVQVVGLLTVTEPGEQVTVVCVVWAVGGTEVTWKTTLTEWDRLPLIPVTVAA